MKKARENRRGMLTHVPECCLWGAVVGLATLLMLFMMPMVDLQMDQSSAWAKGPSGKAVQSGQGADKETGMGQKGSQGAKKITGKSSGAKDVKSVILADEGEDDSDRPAWAQGNRDLNPHNQGGGQPGEAGSKKGDMYGDLWIILRDLDGVPMLDVNGYVQPLVLEDGVLVPIQLTVDGELPPEYANLVEEVEFGRLSIGRAPSKVADHALDEVLTKLGTVDTVSFDLAGRLLVNGATIDSPLENLALYIALMTDDPALNPVLDMLLAETDKLTLAASLFAAAADKTGEINVDIVAYQNVILGIAAMTEGDFIDYSGFDYSRDETYAGMDITYFVQKADGSVITVTEPILTAVFGDESYDTDSGEGIIDFTQASDDALQMIEFVHTTIHIE